jgi:multidrug resistance efflux pump
LIAEIFQRNSHAVSRNRTLQHLVRLLTLILSSLLLVHCRQSEVGASSEVPPIEIKATVQPAQSMTIAAQIDGQIETVSVSEGGAVEANGAIAQLTNAAIQREATVSRAQREWIEARLRRGGHGAPRVSAPSGDGVAITAAILEKRRQRLDTMRRLRKSNDISARELEEAEIAYLFAQRDYNSERRAAVGAPVVSDDLELLRIEKQKADAEASFASSRQAQLRIVSPIKGTVTRLHVTPGQSVYPRDPIADVSNLSSMVVQGEVAPELLRYLKAGMAVDVKIYSVPPRVFAEEIDSIRPVQTGASGSPSATVIVTIANPDGSLQPNSQATITLRPFK